MNDVEYFMATDLRNSYNF